MKNIIFFIFILVNIGSVYGQSPQNFILQRGTRLDDLIRPDLLYYFSEFKNGFIYYKSKPAEYGKFNYNMFHDEIQFLNENGNKMALASYSDVAYVSINNQIFLYLNNGIFEVVESGRNSLLIKRRCVVKETGKVINSTFVSHGSNVDQETNVVVNGVPKTINTKREALAKVEITPYLLNGKKITLANDIHKIKKIYNKDSEIDKYLISFPVDVNNVEDIKRLIVYCNSL